MVDEAEDEWTGHPRPGLQHVVPDHRDSALERVARGLKGELGRTLLEPLPPGWHALLRQLGEAEQGSQNWGATGPHA
jgi:hypothetical protein